ncbi:MAG TPA: SpoIIE family protein phosphatase [Streptosporangiaceae bacterium]|nr:SpoIIE family protein phosphatase [Streptosporangiaceae bacterium]
MSGTESPGPAHLVFPGGSEMARRMRAYPWDTTPLGDPQDWPASLRIACRICLTSRFPMIVWWGEDLRFLYNDAYLPLLGTKHPALAMPGAQVWPEVWHIVGPMLGSVMSRGQATWSQDLLLPVNRHGYVEESYWTYSYSPLHDGRGAVRGVFTAVRDTTEIVVGERRLAALRDLSAQAGSARSAVEACELAARALGRAARDVPFAAIYLRRPGSGGLTLAASSPEGADPRLLACGPGGWPAQQVLHTGRPVTVTDVRARFGKLPSGEWQAPPEQAVVLPLPGDAGEQPAGVIVLAASAGRALDGAYESFLGMVARETAALVNAAVAYQAQQRRAEELAELDRAKTVFFSNVSHEFRTPLTLIMGPVEELRAGLAGRDGAVRERLDVIHRNALRLGKLVNTLLDFSRIEAGRMQASYGPADLAAVTAELASVFRSAIERAGLSFHVDCPPLPEPVYIDIQMWEKVVLNLLSNALKFTFEGTISVSLRAEDGQAVLRVADTGTGIPAAEMGRLFERFHRIPSARSRSHEGSGIGLALVRELVGLHGGTITADSTEGAGTTFTVRLPFGHSHLPEASLAPATVQDAGPATAGPFVDEAMSWLPDGGGHRDEPVTPDAGVPLWAGAGSAASREGARAASGNRGGGAAGEAGGAAGNDVPRVLVVDDNADMRDYLRRLLRPGYRVITAADGQAALDAARADVPDLVISDVMMPGRGGLDLVAALRADPRTAGVPVLLLSARAGQEAAIDGLDAGADDYLVKPFSAADLLARARANVELARLRSHHARWRTALINSLQDGFFVSDEAGTVTEINPAFTDILGFGPEGLPYRPRHPWWPPKGAYPEARRQLREALARAAKESGGHAVVPVVHRDGHLLWVAANFSEVREPGTGRRMLVGTFRDITAHRYALRREEALAALSMRLSKADSLPEAIQGAIGELQELWRARRVLAVTWDGNGAGQPSLASTGGTQPAGRWEDLPDHLRTAISALRERPLLHPVARQSASAGITLRHPKGLLTLWVELDPGRPFTDEDQTLLALLGGYLGQALQRTQEISQQREAALALQHAILGPPTLPPGFTARYEPAARPLEVGGDWYDIVRLPGGRIGIVVGDCVGHDLEAATIMGQLRSACRALLLHDASPAQALDGLDQFAVLTPGAVCATVFCGILDPGNGRLAYSSAGHPPGIVTRPGGRTELLDEARSFPLAVQPGAGRPEAGCTLADGATLLLYTDGLVERRRWTIDEGIDRARAVLADGRTAPLEDLASRLMTRMTPPGGYGDDVAFLLYRHAVNLGGRSSRTLRVPAEAPTVHRPLPRACDPGPLGR